MPLWLWQEVQALPWSTEIVALTCGTQNCLRPPSSLLKRPRQACCATPVQDQKCWNTAAFEQSQFIEHTGTPIAIARRREEEFLRLACIVGEQFDGLPSACEIR